MQSFRLRMNEENLRFNVLIVVIVLVFGSSTWAADIRLKNGTILRGNFLVSNKLSGVYKGVAEQGRVDDRDIEPQPIGRVDNGWQRVYFPMRQRQGLNQKQEAGLAATKPITFSQFRPVIRRGSMIVSQFGSMRAIEPFDEWGGRRLKIQTEKGPSDVIQQITEATPDHVIVTSINYDWKLGLPLKSVPYEMLSTMLRRQIKVDDFPARLALAKFYIQAEYFIPAFEELSAIANDFPDQKALITSVQSDLMSYFGRDVLRRLAKRQRAGQHKIAESYAKELFKQALDGNVKHDVEEYIRKYDETRQTIERVKLLLGDWQDKLTDAELVNRLQPLRSEINEQLDFETLPRLDAFLKAEADASFEPSQRLGLAYSGWLLGAANSEPDLDQAVRIWNARQIVMDYLRTDDVVAQKDLIRKLESIENFSPDKMLINLIPQLPSLLDASIVEPGAEAQIKTAADEQVSYWVKLPMEYTPHHSYPLVVAMRPNFVTAQGALSAWAGGANDPDLGHQRGYIVIAPEYAPNGTTEYSFGANVHKYVLDCLIDARKRFSVDSNRVFLAGHGMGGDAAFDIGVSHPDEFAGVLALGGNAVNYVSYTWKNASYTAWYVVGKGYDSNGNRNDKGDLVFDRFMHNGIKYDFMLVEYMGRNGDNMIDDLGKLYDWMDLHKRESQPKQMSMLTLRKADNRFFWLTASALPNDFVLPAPAIAGQTITPMTIEAAIAQPGNIISLKSSPTKNYTVRLFPDLIDFGKRLRIKVGDHVVFNEFVSPEVTTMLQDLIARGDRTRIPFAIYNPQ